MKDTDRFSTTVVTPLGPMTASFRGRDLVGLAFDGRVTSAPSPVPDDVAPSLDALRAALGAYFAGRGLAVGIPLAPGGTPFQRAVWAALRDIPYGQTATYAEVARRIGRPRAVRAVGAANARNPIAILVPCHRVIGADGSLTGYAGGLERKRALLELEAGAA